MNQLYLSFSSGESPFTFHGTGYLIILNSDNILLGKFYLLIISLQNIIYW
jgi:hypothetical protein